MTALLRQLSADDTAVLKGVFATSFQPDDVGDDHAATQNRVLKAFAGGLLGHTIPASDWDVARVEGGSAQPMELKVPTPATEHTCARYASVCGIDDCYSMRMETKDYVHLLGSVTVEDQDGWLERVETANALSGLSGSRVRQTLLDVPAADVSVNRTDGMPVLVALPSDGALLMVTYEALFCAVSSSDFMFNGLTRLPFADGGSIFLAAAALDHHDAVFYCKCLCSDDSGKESKQGYEWDAVLKIGVDGDATVEAGPYGERVVYDSVQEFESSDFAVGEGLTLPDLGIHLRFVCVSSKPDSTFYIGNLENDDASTLCDKLDEALARAPRRAMGDSRSLAFDAAVLTGFDGGNIRRLFNIGYEEFVDKLDTRDWSKDQLGILEAFCVAGGFSAASPGTDARAAVAFLASLCSAAWFSSRSQFNRVDLEDRESCAVFDEMFRSWAGLSRAKFRAECEIFDTMRDLMAVDEAGEIIVYELDGEPVVVGSRVVVLEARTDRVARLRVIEVKSQDSGRARAYWPGLVKSLTNVCLCAKDLVTRTLFQSTMTWDFKQAGMQLVASPTQGISGLNGKILISVGEKEKIVVPVAIVFGANAIVGLDGKKGIVTYEAPSGVVLDGANSTVLYDDGPNNVAAFVFASAPFRPALVVSLRATFMMLAARVLKQPTVPYSALKNANTDAYVRLNKGTQSEIGGRGKVIHQRPLFGLFRHFTQSVAGDAEGVLPLVDIGSAEASGILRAAAEDVLVEVVVSIADCLRPRKPPAAAEPAAKRSRSRASDRDLVVTGAIFVDEDGPWRVHSIKGEGTGRPSWAYYYEASLGYRGTLADCERSYVSQVAEWIKATPAREARAAEPSPPESPEQVKAKVTALVSRLVAASSRRGSLLPVAASPLAVPYAPLELVVEYQGLTVAKLKTMLRKRDAGGGVATPGTKGALIELLETKDAAGVPWRL